MLPVSPISEVLKAVTFTVSPMPVLTSGTLLPPHVATFVLPKFSRDFCVPQAPAALLKAALICAGIVTLPSPPPSDGADSATKSADIPARTSLHEQLGAVFGSGGIRITSRSGLPQGSGMGTSSILAGEGAVRPVRCPKAGAYWLISIGLLALSFDMGSNAQLQYPPRCRPF